MRTQPALLPLKAAAKALGVHPDNLKLEAEAGRVPHTRLGDEFLFSLSALELALVELASGLSKEVAHAR